MVVTRALANPAARTEDDLTTWFHCPSWCKTMMRAYRDQGDMQLKIEHGPDAGSFSLHYMSFEQMRQAMADWWATLHQESPPNLNEQ